MNREGEIKTFVKSVQGAQRSEDGTRDRLSKGASNQSTKERSNESPRNPVVKGPSNRMTLNPNDFHCGSISPLSLPKKIFDKKDSRGGIGF
jgi:hypothetical protein